MHAFPVTPIARARHTAASGRSVLRRRGLAGMRIENAPPASVVGPGGMPVSSSVREAGRHAPTSARPNGVGVREVAA